ncbi:MAG TPA: hypothetical protein VGI07_10610 [Solirubrobacteraceae bacterium]
MLVAALLVASGTALAAVRPHSLRPAPVQHSGLPSPAPTAASQAAALSQMTGLSPQQVSIRSACPAPAPGQAACAADVAIVRSSGALVHPRLHPQNALADVRPGPAGRRGLPRSSAPAAGASAASAVAVGSSSAGTSAPAPGTPAWLQQAYDLSYLSATQGSGDTIAVIDAFNDWYAESDLATFRSTYGLPACTTANGCFRKVNQSGSSSHLPPQNSAWATEIALDLDAVSSLCPNCHIILVEANSTSPTDLQAAMATGVRLGANQLSDSWAITSSTPITDQFTWPNVATIAATGDLGYNGYLGTTSGAAYPAAVPGVTAAGGTTLAAATSGARGFAESAWSDAGSDCAVKETKPSYQTDTGCTGRAYADVSAVADPNTGLSVYDTGSGGWVLMGGTSLATPLIAADEAVTGVSGVTPRWAYDDSALLNDPVSGSNGPCAASIFYICNAGPAYDGPTGVGSISGDVTSGGPGIGGPTAGSGSSYAETVDATSAAMTGGIYPNGNDTTYWWQYGTTNTYGEQTAPTDIGAGSTPVAVSDTLPGLSPTTTYHYRLVASNSAGTTYGYDYMFTTPAAGAAPMQAGAGTSQGGGALAEGQLVSPESFTTTASSSPTAPVTTSPTAPVTTSPSAPVTTSSTGPASTSPPAPVSAPHVSTPPVPVPVIVAAPGLSGGSRVGATLKLSGGSYRNGTVTAVQFERCAQTCVPVTRGGSGSVTVTAADAGYYMRAWVTVSGPGGSVSTWANTAIGPVRSRTAGAAALQPGTGTIRGSAGRALARVSTSRKRSAAHPASAGTDSTATVRFTRLSGSRAPLRVWACVARAGSPVSCTAPRAVQHTVSFTLTVPAGDRAVLVAVTQG